MSALIPPKHDLRGGKASADSFAISSIALVASTKRSLVAAESCEHVCDGGWSDLIQELSPISFPLEIWRNFFGRSDIIEIVSEGWELGSSLSSASRGKSVITYDRNVSRTRS